MITVCSGILMYGSSSWLKLWLPSGSEGVSLYSAETQAGFAHTYKYAYRHLNTAW